MENGYPTTYGIIISSCKQYQRLHESFLPFVREQSKNYPVVFSVADWGKPEWVGGYMGVENVYLMGLPFNAYECSWMVDVSHPCSFIRHQLGNVRYWLHLHDTCEIGEEFSVRFAEVVRRTSETRMALVPLAWELDRMQFFIGVYDSYVFHPWQEAYFSTFPKKRKQDIVTVELRLDGYNGVEGRLGDIDRQFYTPNMILGDHFCKFSSEKSRRGVYLPALDVTKYYVIDGHLGQHPGI